MAHRYGLTKKGKDVADSGEYKPAPIPTPGSKYSLFPGADYDVQRLDNDDWAVLYALDDVQFSSHKGTLTRQEIQERTGLHNLQIRAALTVMRRYGLVRQYKGIH